jgi:ParB family chromosome partitioning protein
MATKKQASSITETQKGTASAVPTPEFKLITLDLIDDPEFAMRTDITPESVVDLVLSIRQVGIIEPLVVKPRNDRYEIIAGHRRLTAAKIAKIPQAPCYVMHVGSEQTEMLKIHENLYRAEVRPSDEALHFKYLIEKMKMTPVRIAQFIGKSDSYVSDRLAIFNYPPELKEALDKKQVSFSVAREFARLDDVKTMREYLYYALRNGITQEGARKWVQDYKRSKEQPQVQENQYYNPETQTQEIEHFTQCIYCRGDMKLIEAHVAYIHGECLQEASKPDSPVNSTPQNS